MNPKIKKMGAKQYHFSTKYVKKKTRENLKVTRLTEQAFIRLPDLRDQQFDNENQAIAS